MSYKGTAADGDRAALLLKEREKRRQELERQKQEIARKEEIAGRNIGAKFATTQQDFEAQLRAQTYGLVTLEEMKKRQQLLEEERVRKQKADDEGDKHKKKRKKKQQKVTVSFDEEDELGDDDIAESDAVAKKAKVVKDPTVDTSFLPDREREEQEKRDRERLRAEWIEKTKAMKEELIEITYSYWDGSGHRRTIQMKKGDSIQQFLQAVLADLRGEFHELRGVTAENLMYVKEDLIIPSHYTFYDFIITKARGKSGPLFNFDVHDDVRLLNDATVEKDESHAGKVMLRSWYERNKHIFPASRWEPYDPEKKWEKYSISDKGKARA